MPNFNLALNLILLVGLTQVYGADKHLRGLQTNPHLFGFNQSVGTCQGATCGGWGDPHIISCDGLEWDCQGLGIFKIMENFMFDIQGTFVGMKEKEAYIIRNKFPYGASVTNDIMVRYKDQDKSDANVDCENEKTIQLSFGDIDHVTNGLGHLSEEEGCMTNMYYEGDHPDHDSINVENHFECRLACKARPGCDAWSYWNNNKCHFADSTSQEVKTSHSGWTEVVAGVLGTECGMSDPADRNPASDEQKAKMTTLKKNCPLVMFVDGQMIDISDVGNAGELWSSNDGFITATLSGNNQIELDYKTSRLIGSGSAADDAKIQIRRGGNGLGENWSCNWEWWLCLPAAFQQQFMDTTVGLMGSPDGNQTNDWFTKDGIFVEVHNNNNEDKEQIDYCVDNWCVDEEDSLMVYHGDKTYDDYGCERPEGPEVDCVVSDAVLDEKCNHLSFHLVRGCRMDCCNGISCDPPEPPAEPPIVPLGDDDDDEPPHLIVDACEEVVFDKLPDKYCPEKGGAVKLISSKGGVDIPDGAVVFYGMDTHSEPTGEVGMDTVRFKINNPFGDAADVYVKYNSPYMGFMDNKCHLTEEKVPGCEATETIEAACHEFPGQEPFALVELYFASTSITSDDDATIDKCCQPTDYPPEFGVVSFTFEVQCECPEPE